MTGLVRKGAGPELLRTAPGRGRRGREQHRIPLARQPRPLAPRREWCCPDPPLDVLGAWPCPRDGE